MSDNFHFDLTGVPLNKCLEVATLHHKSIGYRIQTTPEEDYCARDWTPTSPAGRMILYWSDQDTQKPINRFPAVMGIEELAPIIKAWLSERQYGPQPDHDGSNSKGWRVYNEGWAQVNGEWQAFVAIEPVWLEYGK